ncbi:MAG: substrate-binding domain-containing protein [Thermodesulfobacteriota bacterium]
MKEFLFPCLALLLFLIPSSTFSAESSPFVFMASTIGPIDSGIVSVLEDQFEKETGIRVRHVGAGTSAALKIAQGGAVDLVMVHAKSLEEKFIQDGFGTQRIPFMYNDFVILGPAADPAGIKGMKSAAEALKTIAVKAVPFISRGDKSGTHVAEMELWEKAGLKPSGPWYKIYEKGSEGNAATLKYTDQQGAYTFMDRATFLSLQKSINLTILVEKDEALLNFISLLPVNPQKFPKINQKDALAFVAWLTDPKKGQLIVRDFGMDTYGSPLFFPNSDEWKAAQKK